MKTEAEIWKELYKRLGRRCTTYSGKKANQNFCRALLWVMGATGSGSTRVPIERLVNLKEILKEEEQKDPDNQVKNV